MRVVGWMEMFSTKFGKHTSANFRAFMAILDAYSMSKYFR
ncbi:hypothetical protein FHW16_000910 [Phyllobacterium myrsinacearum]|uniref:Uncharacterized protein n=1 Tax=Phyllobacterium myrsinacearum TaxID=28101 RepID=A0A839EFR6_9HYPH|nr:hypothetical protein [Phyllobacterium myrsinacearum]